MEYLAFILSLVAASLVSYKYLTRKKRHKHIVDWPDVATCYSDECIQAYDVAYQAYLKRKQTQQAI